MFLWIFWFDLVGVLVLFGVGFVVWLGFGLVSAWVFLFGSGFHCSPQPHAL